MPDDSDLEAPREDERQPVDNSTTGQSASAASEQETRLVEYACRHRDILSRPLYGYWLDTTDHCDVCDKHRKIVWTDDD